MEHPDISNAYWTGYATFQAPENADCPEARAEYIDEHIIEFAMWIKSEHPEIISEYIERNYTDFEYWIN